ncbi:hypothetical protein C2R22_12495 [Salinigranum rubrum]|uniref:Uncharacterized protein n=1 Tax=Salinigranum rubrum TaxID=755307 RepID=A0A2I8VKA0_9EURY|nr:hypothetical protein [Salinigranum rubrum]AUV82360.1 hypothetical protein C2R22_12495 [Salinigranum rubrum]
MSSVRLKPGPVSTRAFNLGSLAAALLACAISGFYLWNGALTLPELVLLSVVAFPPYLLLVVCVLGVWLGFSDDARVRGRLR